MRNGGKWTEAKWHAFIKGGLRQLSSRWPPSYQCMNDAYTRTKVNAATGRMAKHYRCADCGGEFPAKDVARDHVDPVVDPTKGFVGWDELIQRMFCEADGFQVLCKTCHKKKTDQEKQIAKERRKNEREKSADNL